MDLITSLIQPCLPRAVDTLVRQIGYLKTKTIIKELAEATRDLEAKRNDIQTEIEAAARDRKHCTQQVQRWIQKVNETIVEATAIQNDYERRSSGCNLFGAHAPNCCCRSRYRTGRSASKMLAKVIGLEKEPADFGATSMPQPPVPVQEIIPSTSIKGGTMMASYLDIVRHYLEEEDGYVVIGIWGMGGVGKTTLLQAINNVYLHQSAAEGTKFFDHVVFVVVSKDHRSEKLQKDIINRLGLSNSSDDDVDSQAAVLFDILKEKSFLLLLDDVWEAVDLRAIGIPRGRNCKVVVTTRSEEVCGRMDSRKRIKVECLGKEEAWNLFKEKVGEDLLDSHPDLKSLATEVARECGGLPLALIVIGHAMSTKRTPEAWKHAITQLRKSQPSNTILGMEESMFPNLKFSYDNLHDDRMRGCFLCCSMWPEDFGIPKEDLIAAWMGMGFIDDFDDINEAYNLGHFFIESLIATSLLSESTEDDRKVKMHDVIRDLALWIACDCGKERNRWLVKANADLRRVPPSDVADKWGEARQISLMWNIITELPRNLPAAHSPNLSVLFLQYNGLRRLPEGFLLCMPNLTYLDLSNNLHLEEVPSEIGALVKLRYLNLTATNILSLPDELGQLSNLKYLLLGYTSDPVSIPNTVLSSLSKLEVLDLHPETELSNVYDDEEDEYSTSWLSGLKALGVKVKSLKHLQRLSRHQIGITRLRMEDMRDSISFHLHEFNSITRGCLQRWILRDCCDVVKLVMDISCSLPRLEELELDNLGNMREVVWSSVVPSECFRRLRDLTIRKCPLLRNITWILLLPLLVSLDVICCDAMEHLIISQQVDGETRQGSTFPCLKFLYLTELPRLCDICGDHALVNFPSLETVQVKDCPELMKFPFRPQVNCRKLRSIRGSAIWWYSMEWEDEGIKSSFQPLTFLW